MSISIYFITKLILNRTKCFILHEGICHEAVVSEVRSLMIFEKSSQVTI